MRVWLMIITFFICPLVMALPGKDITVLEFSQFLKSPWTQEIPEDFNNLPLQELHMHKNMISFKLKGFPFFIELVGSEKVTLKLNGKEFSPQDLKTFKMTRHQIIKKFKLKKPVYSLMDWLFPQAFAALVTADIPDSEIIRLRNMGYNVQFGQQQQTFPDMQSLLNAVGPNQMNGYLAVIAAFLGGSDQIMAMPGFQNLFNSGTGSNIEPFRLDSSK